MSAIEVIGQSSHATLVFPVKDDPLGRIAASAGADFVREMLKAGLGPTVSARLAHPAWGATDTVVRFDEKKRPEDKGKRVTIEYKEKYHHTPSAVAAEDTPPACADVSALVWVIEDNTEADRATQIPEGLLGVPLILATTILRPAEHHTRPPESGDDFKLWKNIGDRLKDCTAEPKILVTSADAFRRAGYRTREEGSMSATVEDICSTVNGSDTDAGNRDGRKEFGEFTDLFIRLRGDGVLYLKRVAASTQATKAEWDGKLYYTRESNVDDWVQHRGRHYGVDSLLTTSVVRWLAAEEKDKEALILEGVERIWMLVKKGSVMPRKGWNFELWVKTLWGWVTPQAALARRACPAASDVPDAPEPPCKVVEKDAANCTVESLTISLELTRERNRWSLLEECIGKIKVPEALRPYRSPAAKELEAQTQFYARHVARHGYEKGWEAEKAAPAGAAKLPEIKYFELGKLKTVDRAEVEGLCGLKRLIHGYPAQLAALDGKAETPLCLAVFGAPGSGKSFGVKQIAANLAAQSDAGQGTFQISKRILEFNVSQFTELGDLANAMQDIREERLAGKIPVVIFDEFDASFGGQGFGWLKYFLMPMQDGKFRDEQTDYRTGGCIMVFAGGINHNFAEFTGRQRDKEFATAKGPDFISRLRGVLNIPSMTRDDSQRFPLWQIRRAGLLHNYLESKGAKMTDLRLLDALLTVGRFHHGARSLEAIIQMCDKNAQGQIDLTSLPRREQLDLHVDANEFWSLIHAREPAPGTLGA